MTGPAPAAPVPVPPRPLLPAREERAVAPPREVTPDAFAEAAPTDPFGDEAWPEPYDEGAQPDPFADASPAPPAPEGERPGAVARGPSRGRAAAEALAEAAAGERLGLLRSVFPGRVVRLVPHAAPAGATGRTPGPGEDPDAEPFDATPDANGVEPEANEPGGSA